MRLSMALLVCALTLPLASCSSNNKGKIVGKWKSDDLSSQAKDKLPPGAVVRLILEFTADGKFIMSREGTMLGQTITETVSSGTYSLGMGNNVTIDNMNPPLDGKTKGRDKIVINGDKMTLDTERGQKIILTRVTDAAPAPAAPKQ